MALIRGSILIYLSLLVSQALSFEFREFCGFGKGSVGINLEVEVQFPDQFIEKYPILKGLKKRIYLTCNNSQKCSGYITGGGFLDTYVLKRPEVSYISDSVAVITDGPNEFTLDRITSTFRWVENLSDGGVALKSCPKGSMFK